MKHRLFFSWLLSAVLLLGLAHPVLPVRAASTDELARTMHDAILYNEEADLSPWALTPDELNEVFCRLEDQGQLPWFTDRYTYYHRDGLITRFVPDNLDPGEYDYDRYEQALRQILSDTITDGMSQWQIALALHDYIASHCAYDESKTLHEGYDAIVRGTAVCSGYARAYQDLMLLAGIPCHYVSGNPDDPPGHGWNLVQIGSSWYHVDITWDDPIPNVEGRVSHEYFLLTDDEIRQKDHYDWKSDLHCTDTSMQQGYWREIESPVCSLDWDHSFYALFDRDSWTWQICSRDDRTGEATVLYEPEREYLDIGAGRYTYPHYGLSLYDGRLYFSSMDTVYSMNTDGSDLQTVHWHDAASRGSAITGLSVEDGLLLLSYRDHDFESITGERFDLGIRENRHLHQYQEQAIAGTCQERGYTLFTCSCGGSYKSRFTALGDHSYQAEKIREPSIEQEGLTRYRCIWCDDSYDEPIPRLDPPETTTHTHSFRKTVIKPTCTEGGYTLYECDCGETRKDDFTDPLNHFYQVVQTVKATETADGWQRWRCARCGDSYDQVLPRLEKPKASSAFSPWRLVLIGGGLLALLLLPGKKKK